MSWSRQLCAVPRVCYTAPEKSEDMQTELLDDDEVLALFGTGEAALSPSMMERLHAQYDRSEYNVMVIALYVPEDRPGGRSIPGLPDTDILIQNCGAVIDAVVAHAGCRADVNTLGAETVRVANRADGLPPFNAALVSYKDKGAEEADSSKDEL